MNRKFRMPGKSNLKNRSSTINNAFAIAITPYLPPSSDNLDWYYDELGINPDQCGYCLQESNSVDHIRPLVRKGLPTGYITNIYNLIPCCSTCNSKKGAKDFQEWYCGNDNIARLHTLGLSDEQIQERFSIICRFIEKHMPEPLDYEQILGKDSWDEYKRRKDRIIEQLVDNQRFCDELKQRIEEYLAEPSRKREI